MLNKNTKLSIKNLKWGKGHTSYEPTMSCTLYVDGKRAATIYDDSRGGELEIKILNPKAYTLSYNELVECIHDLVTDFDNLKETKKHAKKNILVREIGKTYSAGDYEMYPYMPTPNNVKQVQAMNKYIIWNINEAW